MNVGKRLKDLRERYGFTSQESLAAAAGKDRGQISKIESNHNSPQVDTLENILEKMGSSLSEFFEGRNWSGFEGIEPHHVLWLEKVLDVLKAEDPLYTTSLQNNIDSFHHSVIRLGGSKPKTRSSKKHKPAREAKRRAG